MINKIIAGVLFAIALFITYYFLKEIVTGYFLMFKHLRLVLL